MALKRLASTIINSTTNINIYTTPALKEARATLNICNLNEYSVNIWVALVENGAAEDLVQADYIEYCNTVWGHRSIYIRDIEMAAGDTLVVRASHGNVNTTLWGAEGTSL